MRMIETMNHYRNDFHWDGECEHCGHVERYRDGYADDYYCYRVVPGRHCPKCGINSLGQNRNATDQPVATAAQP